MVEMGTLSPEADRQVMANVMELAIADVRGEELEQYRVQQVIQQVEDTIYEFPLRLPRNFALILRVATVVEGVCVTLDPDFDFIEVATDYLGDEGYREETARKIATNAGQQVRDTTEALFTVPPRLDDVLSTVQREALAVNVRIEDQNNVLDRLARRIVYGLILGVGVLSTAVLYSFNETPEAAIAAAVLTIPFGILLYRSLRPDKGLSAQPQFTRQEMRRRRDEDAAGESGGMVLAADNVQQEDASTSADGDER